VSAGDPLLQVGPFGADGGVWPVAGLDDRVRVDDQQPIEAHGAARVPGRVQHHESGARDRDRLPVGQVPVGSPGGVGLIP
jgi:hypothetical protein